MIVLDTGGDVKNSVTRSTNIDWDLCARHCLGTGDTTANKGAIASAPVAGEGEKNLEKKTQVKWEKCFEQIEQGKGIESEWKRWGWVRLIIYMGGQQDFFEEVIWNIESTGLELD